MPCVFRNRPAEGALASLTGGAAAAGPCPGRAPKARRIFERRGSTLSLLARLAPHLPYVRRYARALTGDQTTGDNYVRATLEALAAGERQLEATATPRVALYQVFHAIWSTAG